MKWDEDDQWKALAWQTEKDDKCPGCGAQSWEEGDLTPVRVTCLTCASVQQRSALEFGHKQPSNPGMRIGLKRKDSNG